MRLIKDLNEFDNLNEGILSSLLRGAKNLLSSDKGKLEDILRKIKKAREEEVENSIKIEKQIASISKEDSVDSRFALTNLRKQSRSHSGLKGTEINSLIKNAREIIKGDTQMEAFFSSELAKIEVETQEKLIKSIGSYTDSYHLNQLNSEFDSLVKDANQKTSYADSIVGAPSYMPDISVPPSMSDDVVSFLNLNSKEASFTCRELDSGNLNNYYTQVKDFFFDLEDKYTRSMEDLKRGKKEAEKYGDRSGAKKIERDEINLKYHLRKAIDKLRGRLNTIEKEMRNRRNG
jgi:hypothetical protein